jgi:hypothetical protein
MHKQNHALTVCFYLAVVILAAEAVIMSVLHFLPQLGLKWTGCLDHETRFLR